MQYPISIISYKGEITRKKQRGFMEETGKISGKARMDGGCYSPSSSVSWSNRYPTPQTFFCTECLN